MIPRLRIAAALSAAVLLAACAGSGNNATQPTNLLIPKPNVVGLQSARVTIAGIGDSLTAGVQSGGLLGADLPVLGTNPQVGQIGPVQRTQEHGFFALLWEQANGVDINALSNPASSPLPLMKPLGLGSLLAPTTSGFPAPVTNLCDQNQAAANSFSTALSLRLNPGSIPYDVAVPGQTVHEALFMVGPTSDCAINAQNAPGQIVALNALVNGESQHFWPVLGTFGQGVPQVAAAAALHAQIATVSLGSDDLLKIAGSNGRSPVVPSAQAVHDDTKAIIQQLQGAGSKVVVASLIDVLGAAAFIPQPKYTAFLQAGIQKANPALPAAVAQAVAQQYATAEIQATGLGAAGYFTINAFFKTLQAAAVSGPPPTLATTGDYVSDAVATTVKQLNTAYNQQIAAAVNETGAALADVAAVFAQIQTAGGIPINPPKCCSPLYGGGLASLDGIHPSNTGYALIAKAFIDALNAKYNLGITPIDAQIPAIYASDPYAPH